MADLRPQRRIEELEGDREALEHIARALEGRVHRSNPSDVRQPTHSDGLASAKFEPGEILEGA